MYMEMAKFFIVHFSNFLMKRLKIFLRKDEIPYSTTKSVFLTVLFLKFHLSQSSDDNCICPDLSVFIKTQRFDLLYYIQRESHNNEMPELNF